MDIGLGWTGVMGGLWVTDLVRIEELFETIYYFLIERVLCKEII